MCRIIYRCCRSRSESYCGRPISDIEVVKVRHSAEETESLVFAVNVKKATP